MTPTQATWVRRHAWTAPVRAEARLSRGSLAGGPCLCLRPFTAAVCSEGGSHECTAPYIYAAESVLIGSRGWVYDLSKPEQAGRTRALWVWLADRVCRHRCGCVCHPRRRRRAAAVPAGQLGLFEGVAR